MFPQKMEVVAFCLDFYVVLMFGCISLAFCLLGYFASCLRPAAPQRAPYTSPQLVSHGTQTLAYSPEATTSVATSGHPVTATLASQNPESEAGLTGPRPGPLDTSVSSIV